MLTGIDKQPYVGAYRNGAISIVHMRSDRHEHPETGPLPQADALNVITQLKGFERHRLWRAGKLIFDGGHPAAALAITDLSDDWRCAHCSPFDNVRFTIAKGALSGFAYESGFRFKGLSCPAGQRDPIVRELASALILSLGRHVKADTLLADHILVALQVHLITRYGGGDAFALRRGGMTARQLARAKDILTSTVGRPIGISDVARQCGLSASHFIRTFKISTGRTPHQWLLEYKTEKARQMLLGSASIAEIAVACGFVDQSHLTRIFNSLNGVSPGIWRREHRG